MQYMKTSVVYTFAFCILWSCAALATTSGCVVGVSPGKELNLRAGPGKRFQIVGGLRADSCGVAISSDCYHGFCRVWRGQQSGWASAGFLRRGANATKVPDLVWVPLGQRVVSFAVDRDVIRVARSAGRFRAIQFRVSDNDVFIFELRVVYGNGNAERIPVREEVRAGRRSRVIDLAGRSRLLSRVVLVYRSDRSGTRKAKVELFGIKYDPTSASRTSSDRQTKRDRIKVFAAPNLKWQKLGSQSVQGKLDSDRVLIGQQQGLFRAIQLRVKSYAIRFKDLKIVYGNGSVQDVPIRATIKANSNSRVIDLIGKNRLLKEVRFTYSSPQSGYQPAIVDVYGLSINADYAGRRQWKTKFKASSKRSYTEIGILNCEVSGGIGFIVGSTKDLTCNFNRPGRDARYFGTIRKFGLDVGATTKAVMSWAVLAQTTNIPPGALSGTYSGLSGQATLGVGVGVNALVGGSKRSVILQPISVQAQLGVNLALGISELQLSR